MNLISTPQNEKIIDDDAIKFYDLISTCISEKLNLEKDKIIIYRPDWTSANVNNSIICKINQNRYVVIKKSMSLQKIRREEIISKIKKTLGFLSYNVFVADGLILRTVQTNVNCNLFKGWDNEKILLVDFVNYKLSKPLWKLNKDEIDNFHNFCFEYGKLAAFNFLFSVTDRNSSNFIFFIDTQTLHSVDNEDGPFNIRGNEFTAFMIIDQTRQNIKRLISGTERFEHIQSLRKGFMDGWELISENFSPNMLNRLEKKIFKERLAKDRENISTIFFTTEEENIFRWWKKGEDWCDTDEGRNYLQKHDVILKRNYHMNLFFCWNFNILIFESFLTSYTSTIINWFLNFKSTFRKHFFN